MGSPTEAEADQFSLPKSPIQADFLSVTLLEFGPKSTTKVSESEQNTNTPSHTYPHPEREETVADEPSEVQPYKKQGRAQNKERGNPILAKGPPVPPSHRHCFSSHSPRRTNTISTERALISTRPRKNGCLNPIFNPAPL
jgi:hypothetical protein